MYGLKLVLCNFVVIDSVTKALPMDLFVDQIASSPLWEDGIREELKTTKISEQRLNLMKSKHLVPGNVSMTENIHPINKLWLL